MGTDVDVAFSDAEFDRLLLLPSPPKIFQIFIKLLFSCYLVDQLLLLLLPLDAGTMITVTKLIVAILGTITSS